MSHTFSDVLADGLTRFDGALAATARCPSCRRRIVVQLHLADTSARCWCGASFKVDVCHVAPTVPLDESPRTSPDLPEPITRRYRRTPLLPRRA
jgi:hypothetical protein